MYCEKTDINEGRIAVLNEPLSERYDPLSAGRDIKEDRIVDEVYCGCPCPKISVPIFAAGLLAFDPLS